MQYWVSWCWIRYWTFPPLPENRKLLISNLWFSCPLVLFQIFWVQYLLPEIMERSILDKIFLRQKERDISHPTWIFFWALWFCNKLKNMLLSSRMTTWIPSLYYKYVFFCPCSLKKTPKKQKDSPISILCRAGISS